ncbi:HNH endonuclease [Burkholderia cepacia]|uniref:HNH endonuclease n=1 Tax=Burkholderia cepacia TaxID=292 RepID=UPI0015A65C68|nr:HNH endonuclease [Burkholderia cepacia]
MWASAWSKGKLTFEKDVLNGTRADFPTVYTELGRIKGISANAAKNLLKEKGLTLHHLSTTEIQFIPSDLHGNVPHTGSAADMRKARC